MVCYGSDWGEIMIAPPDSEPPPPYSPPRNKNRILSNPPNLTDSSPSNDVKALNHGPLSAFSPPPPRSTKIHYSQRPPPPPPYTSVPKFDILCHPGPRQTSSPENKRSDKSLRASNNNSDFCVPNHPKGPLLRIGKSLDIPRRGPQAYNTAHRHPNRVCHENFPISDKGQKFPQNNGAPNSRLAYVGIASSLTSKMENKIRNEIPRQTTNREKHDTKPTNSTALGNRPRDPRVRGSRQVEETNSRTKRASQQPLGKTLKIDAAASHNMLDARAQPAHASLKGCGKDSSNKYLVTPPSTSRITAGEYSVINGVGSETRGRLRSYRSLDELSDLLEEESNSLQLGSRSLDDLTEPLYENVSFYKNLKEGRGPSPLTKELRRSRNSPFWNVDKPPELPPRKTNSHPEGEATDISVQLEKLKEIARVLGVKIQRGEITASSSVGRAVSSSLNAERNRLKNAFAIIDNTLHSSIHQGNARVPPPGVPARAPVIHDVSHVLNKDAKPKFAAEEDPFVLEEKRTTSPSCSPETDCISQESGYSSVDSRIYHSTKYSKKDQDKSLKADSVKLRLQGNHESHLSMDVNGTRNCSRSNHDRYFKYDCSDLGSVEKEFTIINPERGLQHDDRTQAFCRKDLRNGFDRISDSLESGSLSLHHERLSNIKPKTDIRRVSRGKSSSLDVESPLNPPHTQDHDIPDRSTHSFTPHDQRRMPSNQRGDLEEFRRCSRTPDELGEPFDRGPEPMSLPCIVGSAAGGKVLYAPHRKSKTTAPPERGNAPFGILSHSSRPYESPSRDEESLRVPPFEGENQAQLGIYIKSVVPGGAADQDGRLQAGDQLLSVDGKSLVGISQEEAAQYMVGTGSVVTLEVARQGALYHGLAPLLSQPSPQVNRADGRRYSNPRLRDKVQASLVPTIPETYNERLIEWDRAPNPKPQHQQVHPGHRPPLPPPSTNTIPRPTRSGSQSTSSDEKRSGGPSAFSVPHRSPPPSSMVNSKSSPNLSLSHPPASSRASGPPEQRRELPPHNLPNHQPPSHHQPPPPSQYPPHAQPRIQSSKSVPSLNSDLSMSGNKSGAHEGFNPSYSRTSSSTSLSNAQQQPQQQQHHQTLHHMQHQQKHHHQQYPVRSRSTQNLNEGNTLTLTGRHPSSPALNTEDDRHYQNVSFHQGTQDPRMGSQRGGRPPIFPSQSSGSQSEQPRPTSAFLNREDVSMGRTEPIHRPTSQQNLRQDPRFGLMGEDPRKRLNGPSILPPQSGPIGETGFPMSPGSGPPSAGGQRPQYPRGHPKYNYNFSGPPPQMSPHSGVHHTQMSPQGGPLPLLPQVSPHGGPTPQMTLPGHPGQMSPQGYYGQPASAQIPSGFSHIIPNQPMSPQYPTGTATASVANGKLPPPTAPKPNRNSGSYGQEPAPEKPIRQNSMEGQQGKPNGPPRPPPPEEGYRDSPPPPPPPTSTHPLMQSSSRVNLPSSAGKQVGMKGPWDKDEKEKFEMRKREAARRWRDEQITALENLGAKTPQEEERMNTLKLEREFQRRAEERLNDDEDDDDEEEEEEEEEGDELGEAELLHREESQKPTVDSRPTNGTAGEGPNEEDRSKRADEIRRKQRELEAAKEAEERLLREAQRRQEEELRRHHIHHHHQQQQLQLQQQQQQHPQPHHHFHHQQQRHQSQASQRLDSLVGSPLNNNNHNNNNNNSNLNSPNGPQSSQRIQPPNVSPLPPERGSSYSVMHQHQTMDGGRQTEKLIHNRNRPVESAPPPVKRVQFSEISQVENHVMFDSNANHEKREDPNDFINEAETLMNSTSPNRGTGATPGVIGAQEVYRDPRQRRLMEQAQKAAASRGPGPEKLTFREKMKMFAMEAEEGDSTPKDRIKHSKAQREIEHGAS